MPLVQLNSQHGAVELHNVFTGPMGAKRDGKPLLCPPALSTRSHPTPQISPQNNSIFTRVSPNRVPLPLKAKKKRKKNPSARSVFLLHISRWEWGHGSPCEQMFRVQRAELFLLHAHDFSRLSVPFL